MEGQSRPFRAKFGGRCHTCQRTFKPGVEVQFLPVGISHVDCPEWKPKPVKPPRVKSQRKRAEVVARRQSRAVRTRVFRAQPDDWLWELVLMLGTESRT